jgi:hypothetical protein
MPTAVAEPKIVKPSILVPTTARSVWTTTPLITPQGFSPAAWANAGVMPIPEGFMMVQNDANFLYVMLDLVNDKGNDPGVGDYFWLTFDVDGNAAITANVDLNYGIYPFWPINIGKQYCLGQGGGLPSPTIQLNRLRNRHSAPLHTRMSRIDSGG